MTTYDTYELSRINMRDGYDKPSDTHLLITMEQCEPSTLAMALLLVQGDDADPNTLTPNEVADVSVLSCLLPFFQKHGITEIHRIIDMPFFMFERWNQTFQEARKRGIIPSEEDGISKDDFEGMMSG